jgi:hypothetical protein
MTHETQHPRRPLRIVIFAVVATALASSVLSLGGSHAAAGSNPTINVLSTRADLVSGGEALVSVSLPAGTDPTTVHMALNGGDVTAQFAVRPNGLYEARLIGIGVGVNQLVATVPGGGAQIAITNHPIGGPVFAGPQIQPWTCQATAVDAQCNQPTTYAYQYKSSVTGQFSAYNPSSPPADVATTTTDNGQTVPYIIRIETGYQDRDEYQAAVLWTFTSANPNPWQPWAPQAQWDGKLEIPGGASCGVNHGTGTPPAVTDNTALSRGMLVAAPTLDNNGQNCNIVVQAEAVEMMKEHLVDAYGPIRYTIGSGCSGGSIYQQQVANAYPGLLNGILPNCSFPDSWSTASDPVDCALLLPYWNTSPALADSWTETQKAAVVDDQTTSVCQSWVNVYMYSQGGNPSQTNSTIIPCGVSSTQEYSASSNPNGVRCTIQDYMPNVLGIRPSSVWSPPEQQVHHGFVNSPYDNVGVQYGLNALIAGTITPQQFADLNAGVGGFDIDLNPTTTRTTADAAGLVNVYHSGALNEGNNLSTVPMLDLRGHDDTEIHSDFRSYAMRLRLDGSGSHDNQAIWTGPVALTGFQGPNGGMTQVGFLLMDQWLTNIYSDTSSLPLPQKIHNGKPAAAVDTCFDSAGNPIATQSLCTSIYPSYGDPRIGSGAPPADDVLKCQLKPLAKSDYPGVTFSDAEWTALQGAFPHGVCDWSKIGVSQSSTVPWQTYQDASGNVIYGGTPLGPSPVSGPIGPGSNVPEVGWQPVLLLAGLGLAGLTLRARRRVHAN